MPVIEYFLVDYGLFYLTMAFFLKVMPFVVWTISLMAFLFVALPEKTLTSTG